MTDQITVPPLQGLAAYLRCEAGGVFVGSPNHETLMQWAREVDALTAANAVSHPKTENAPATEGGAITSESAVAFYEQAFGVKLTDSAQIGGVLRLCNLAANAVSDMGNPITPSSQKTLAFALEGMELHDFNAPEYIISAELMRLNKALSGHAANAVSAFGTLINEGTIASVQPQAQGEVAKKYAENLCISMARKFYPEVTQFEPLDDLFGLLTQIDNMTTGLVRPQATEPAWRPIETAPFYTDVLVSIEGGGVTIGSAAPKFGWTWYETDNAPEDANAIGWMPLPAAPEAKQ